MRNFIFLGFLLIFLTGCVTTQPFSPNNRNVIMYSGRAYSIPYSVKYALVDQNSPISQQQLRLAYGLNCNIGDVVWFEPKSIDEVETYYKKYSALLSPIALNRLQAVRGNIGCSRPLTDQELAFYMHQQNIAIQQAQIAQQNSWVNDLRYILDRANQSMTEAEMRSRQLNINNQNRDVNVNVNVWGGGMGIMPRVEGVR